MNLGVLVIRAVHDGFDLVAINSTSPDEEKLAHAAEEQTLRDQIPLDFLRVPQAGGDAPEIRGVWINPLDSVLDVGKLVFPSAAVKADVRKG